MHNTAKHSLPEEKTRKKGHCIRKSGICAAEAEYQPDPGPKEPGDPQQISQPAGTKGTQKTVKKRQCAAQKEPPA